MTGWNALAEPAWLTERRAEAAEAEETSAATSARVRAALEDGGRANLTVRSRRTGAHVTIVLTAKARKPDGGWLSRATIAGRVGIGDADVIFADDADREWPDSGVGIFDLRTGEWRPRRGADPARLWAAEKALAWALGSYDLEAQADTFLAAECSYCGRKLTDPVSIERGIGPECYGRHTGSKAAARKEE